MKKAYDLMEKELLVNNIIIRKIRKNVWMLNNKVVIAVVKRTIRENHSKSISIQESNRYMQELFKANEGDKKYILAIAFVWNVEGDLQKCTIVPLNEFELVEDCKRDEYPMIYCTEQFTAEEQCVDYHMKVRKSDLIELEIVHERTLRIIKEKL